MRKWHEFIVRMTDSKLKEMGLDEQSEYSSKAMVDLNEIIGFYKSNESEDGTPNTNLLLTSGDSLFVNEEYKNVKKLICQ